MKYGTSINYHSKLWPFISFTGKQTDKLTDGQTEGQKLYDPDLSGHENKTAKQNPLDYSRISLRSKVFQIKGKYQHAFL